MNLAIKYHKKAKVYAVITDNKNENRV